MTTATVRASIVSAISLLQAAIVDLDGGQPAPPAPTPTPVPSVPPPTGTIPAKGVQWHADFRFAEGGSGAQRNFNNLMNLYGSSWAYSYLVMSKSQIANQLVVLEPTWASQVINAFRGAGGYAPAGTLIPFGAVVLQPGYDQYMQGSGKPYPIFKSVNPNVQIPLPYPDQD